jgi:TolB-like protein/tetratricopeptide (TPR) repeat protein
MIQAGRLNSWKEIAAYLGVSTRTAQRWEKIESLPARRHKHEVLSSVFAYPSELDTWWHNRPYLQSLPREASSPGRSIVVLPFLNLNRDEENEILSDGITEELINALSQVPGLQVVARTSAFYFKGKTDDIRTIGARLGVQTILEGSLRRSGDRLRITAQLINVTDGYHIWSERFDHRITDLFDLQEEIADAIVTALQMKLGPARVAGQSIRDDETYELYLEGRYHCNRRTGAGFLRAVECFERILAKDGRMAQAWAGLADCHAFLGPLAGIPFEEAMPRAKAAALKALEIDGSLPDAHCSLGFVLAVFEYDWNCSEAHFRRALQLQPDHASAHVWYGGHVLAPLARLEEAAIHARRACELDPLSPPARSGLAGSWLMSRQPDEAVLAGMATLELDPSYPIALRFLGEAYLLKNMPAEAAAAFSRIEAPVIAAGFLGYCHARSGREASARQILRDLERTGGPSLALQIAAVHLGLGDRDAALEWLRRACAERSMGVHWLKVEPIWDPLRPDPRFHVLLRQLRLSE